MVWPDGVKSGELLPADFMDALDHALSILSWQENLFGDEMPPRWMWHLDWEIESHFELLKSKREAKFGGKAVDDNGAPYESENSLFDEMKSQASSYS